MSVYPCDVHRVSLGLSAALGMRSPISDGASCPHSGAPGREAMIWSRTRQCCYQMKMVVHTLDFRLRHAMHAVLTHRLLLAAAASLSFLRDLDLFGFESESAGLTA